MDAGRLKWPTVADNGFLQGILSASSETGTKSECRATSGRFCNLARAKVSPLALALLIELRRRSTDLAKMAVSSLPARPMRAVLEASNLAMTRTDRTVGR